MTPGCRSLFNKQASGEGQHDQTESSELPAPVFYPHGWAEVGFLLAGIRAGEDAGKQQLYDGDHMFEIQKNVQIPESRGRPVGMVYPFDQMEVGDSFAVPVDATKKIASVQRDIRSAARSPNHRKSHKYVTRSLVEDGQVVVRIWRTA